MARIRSEDQIFFIFNHKALTHEEDDLKDAIVYFFPSSISVDNQCALVGQLMGLVEFFKSFSGSPPLIYTLQKNKVAIKHLGKYTMALSGNRTEPDGVVVTQLNYLYNMFVFYYGSLQQLEKNDDGTILDDLSVMRDIWDCYLPFVRRYGDSVAAAFDSLPVLDLPEHHSVLFLKASHLLQNCQRLKNAIAGCIIYKNRVVCSQLPPDITARLLIIQPEQTQFPCQSIKTGTTWPKGVVLLNVFVNQKEYKCIRQAQSKNCLSDVEKQKHLSQKDDEGMEPLWNNKMKCEPEEFLTKTEGSYENLSIQNKFKSKCHTSKSVNKDNHLYPVSSGHESHSQPDMSDEKSEMKKAAGATCKKPTYSSQRSCEFKGSNVVGIEQQDVDTSDCTEEWLMVQKPLTSVEKTSPDPPAAVRDYRRMQQYQHEATVNGTSPTLDPFHNTASLFNNLKRLTAQSQDILEVSHRQLDLNNDMVDSEDEQDQPTPGYQQNMSASCEDNHMSVEANLSATKSVISGSHLHISVAALDMDGSSLHREDNKLHDEWDIEAHQPSKILAKDVRSHDSNREPIFNIPAAHLSDDSTADSTVSKDLTSGQDSEDSVHENGDFIMLDVYVQAVSNTLLIFLIENDTLTNDDAVNYLISNVSSYLDELEHDLEANCTRVALNQDMPLDYNYLMYDHYTKNLSGQISLSPGVLQPMSHQELDFCGSAIAMHNEFQKSPGLVDITMRNHAVCVYGHRAFSQEVYFQPKHSKPPRGISPAYDTTMCLGDTARQSLLIDKGINVI